MNVLQMLYLDDIPRIEYEYWMPNSKPIESEAYHLPLGALKIISNNDEGIFSGLDFIPRKFRFIILVDFYKFHEIKSQWNG